MWYINYPLFYKKSQLRLEEINFAKNNLQATDMIEVRWGLRNTSTLTSFSVADNNVGIEAADSIAIILSSNGNLAKLYLSGNNFQATGTSVIVRTLQNLKNLTVLSFSNNCAGSKAAKDLSFALLSNTKLKELYLAGNNLQTTGAITITKAIQGISTLTTFSIASNSVGGEAADDIAAVFHHNTKLQEIYLDYNNLEAAGIIVIVKGLKKNLSLRKLSIANNGVDDEAADDIADSLCHRNNLQELCLNGNCFQKTGLDKIAEVLQTIEGLTALNISYNNINRKTAKSIVRLFSHSTQLTVISENL